jgi:predicted ATPase
VTRLVELRIRGLRTLADVTLPLGGLTVLIGDNGTGKSSILEALRIARRVVDGGFMDRLGSEHMLASALRADVGELKLDLRVEADAGNFVYSLSIDPVNRSFTHEAIHELDITAGLQVGTGQPLLLRTPERFAVTSPERTQPTAPSLSLFDYFGRAPDIEAVAVIRKALEGIDVHLPFEVSPAWASRSLGRKSTLREPRVIEPGERLELFGGNLANAYQTLKNSGRGRWRDTLELLQLGLGPELEEVNTPALPGGGHIGLTLEMHGVGHIPSFQLSDGQLAYMAFVALVQLDQGRTLLAFDEPEHHLHPSLLNRVLQLFEDASSRYPVILATHSDRLLDFLPYPAAAVRVCELDSQYRTVVRRLDRTRLDQWAERYSGLGELRAAGQLSSVVAYDEENDAA